MLLGVLELHGALLLLSCALLHHSLLVCGGCGGVLRLLGLRTLQAHHPLLPLAYPLAAVGGSGRVGGAEGLPPAVRPAIKEE